MLFCQSVQVKRKFTPPKKYRRNSISRKVGREKKFKVLARMSCHVIFYFYFYFRSDINECANKSDNNCHHNATCTNTVGSHYCTCNTNDGGSDFEGNGTNCTGTYSSLIILMYYLLFGAYTSPFLISSINIHLSVQNNVYALYELIIST